MLWLKRVRIHCAAPFISKGTAKVDCCSVAILGQNKNETQQNINYITTYIVFENAQVYATLSWWHISDMKMDKS